MNQAQGPPAVRKFQRRKRNLMENAIGNKNQALRQLDRRKRPQQHRGKALERSPKCVSPRIGALPFHNFSKFMDDGRRNGIDSGSGFEGEFLDPVAIHHPQETPFSSQAVLKKSAIVPKKLRLQFFEGLQWLSYLLSRQGSLDAGVDIRSVVQKLLKVHTQIGVLSRRRSGK